MSSSTLERLYDEHAQSLFGFLLNFTRNEADTRDILQEVFLKLAKRPGLLEGVRDCRAFLLQLARNQAIDLMRRRSTRQRNYDQLAAETVEIFLETSNVDEETFRQALEKALSELPDDQRMVIHLKLWEEMTFDAIAEILEISGNTAASRYRYGIDKLREELRPLYKEIT